MVPIKLPVVKVRCTDCGFCALLGGETEEWRRFSKKERDSGKTGYRRKTDGNGAESLEVSCFVDAHPIAAEILIYDPQGGPEPEWEERVKSVIENWRECDRYIKCRPGLTPYQHYEEARMMESQERQQRWDLKLVELQDKLGNRAWWRDFWLVGVFAMVGAIVGAAQLGVAIWVMRHSPSTPTAPPHPSESSR